VRAAASRRAPVRLRLYVAGHTQNSALASANLVAICEAHAAGRHHIEVVDVLLDPKRALADGVLMTPMLVKLGPGPVTRIVGTLSQTQTVVRVLGLDARPRPAPAHSN
jgi:circadian clock protein KaiB